MSILLQDLKFAVRTLAKSPGFTAVAILTLALGIGANTAIFSVVNAVVLRPLPFKNPARLVWSSGSCTLCGHAAVSPADFLDYRAQNHSFEHYGAMAVGDSLFNLTGTDKPIQIKGAMVTAGFFEALAIQPRYGRVFNESDEKTTDPEAVILSHHLWQNSFGEDPQVIGKSISLDGKPRTVVGVLPADIPLLSEADLWFPAPFLNKGMQSRRSHFLRPIGLLKPGVTICQAQSELDSIAAHLATQFPETNAGFGVKLEPLQNVLIGNVRPAFMVLIAAVALVLLIACANIASLLFARNTARQREIGIRTALGAGRGRLLRQLLTESLVLALAGGAGGLLAGWLGSRLLWSFRPAGFDANSIALHMDVRVFAFTAAAALLTGLLFGLVPAIQASAPDLNSILKSGGRGGTESWGGYRLRGLLVVSEIALAMVALMGSGLFIRSMRQAESVDPGFETKSLFVFRFDLASRHYTQQRGREFLRRVVDQAQNTPGIAAAAVAS